MKSAGCPSRRPAHRPRRLPAAGLAASTDSIARSGGGYNPGMARPLRIEFAGAVYHVTSRRNARQDIVRDDMEREKWGDWLRRTVETHNWRLHAWVLTTNHYHLFVETPEPSLAAGMQYLGGSYTSYLTKSLPTGAFRCWSICVEGRPRRPSWTRLASISEWTRARWAPGHRTDDASRAGASPVRPSSGQGGRGLGVWRPEQRDSRRSARRVGQRQTSPHRQETGENAPLITIQALTLRHEKRGKGG